MTQIRTEHIEFVKEARVVFMENARRETYRNDDDTLMALRMGFDRDCIEVWEISKRVANFVQQMPPVPHPGTEL